MMIEIRTEVRTRGTHWKWGGGHVMEFSGAEDVFFTSMGIYMLFKFMKSCAQEVCISLYVNVTSLKRYRISRENYLKICLMAHTSKGKEYVLRLQP